jgi:hypothetical protein
MIFILALAAGLTEVAPPEKAPAPSFIMDLLSENPAQGRSPSGEPERFQRCRVYNCGLPRFPKREKLLDGNDETEETNER